MKRHVHTFDQTVGKSITSLPEWLRPLMLLLTYLGQPIITGGLGTLIIGIGYGSGNQGLKMAGIVAIGTLVVGSLLKLILRRDRPVTEYVEHMFLDTFSFPSGHAAGTVPVFGLVAYLIAGLSEPWGAIAAALIGTITFLIGISRVYLGAHYATDVLGGWVVGLAGLAIIVFIVQPTI
jgi:undecaprenyl-diphosphatase